jgi:hypothetical protein
MILAFGNILFNIVDFCGWLLPVLDAVVGFDMDIIPCGLRYII